MYGLRRRRTTQGQLVRSELGEGFDHLRQAAAHAAGGLGQAVRPRVAAAREYVKPAQIRDAASHGWDSTMAAFGPFAAAAKDGARQAQKAQATQMKRLRKQLKKETPTSRRRWPRLFGVVAAGTAAGAAGAAMIRRRRRQQWDEYDTDRALDEAQSTSGPVDRTVGKASTVVDKAAAKVSSVVEKGGEKLSSALGGAKEKTESATDTTKQQTDRAAGKADDLISKTGSPSRNDRG